MNCNILRLGRLSFKKLQYNNVKLVTLISILQHEYDNQHIQRNVQNLKNTVKKVLLTTISAKSFDRRDKYCFSSLSFLFSPTSWFFTWLSCHWVDYLGAHTYRCVYMFISQFPNFANSRTGWELKSSNLVTHVLGMASVRVRIDCRTSESHPGQKCLIFHLVSLVLREI